MILGARIATLWASRRPFHIICCRHRLCLQLKYSSLSEPKDLDEEDDCFLPWLEEKAGFEVSSVLSIGKAGNDRSLFASRAIRSGDSILKVPFHAQISPDNLLPEIREVLSDEVGNLSKLAIAILLEQKAGQDSRWHPYISRLPRPHEMDSTIFWTKSELEMIHKSPVFEETINQKNQIEREFLAIQRDLQCSPELLESITYNGFMHSYALVTSRAWQSTKGFSLIPFADFFNHDGASKAVVLMDENKQLSEVIADRNYSPGDEEKMITYILTRSLELMLRSGNSEVLIRYGKFSNATLMVDFGFALSCNVYDQVQIQVAIVEDDPLREMKLEYLQRSSRPRNNYINSSGSSNNSFTIKEVRLAGRNKAGLPESLRACARIICCSSPQELNELDIEAACTDGRLARRPLKNINKEIAAHQMLLSQTTQLIEEYNESIKSIGPVKSFPMSEKVARRKQMAQFLLNGELRVLKSASDYLQNYCEKLTQNGFP